MGGWFLVAIVILSGLLLFVYPRWRRKRLLAQPFPPHWQAIVQRSLPFHVRLRTDEKQQLRDLVRLFLADKQFHGCAGVEIDDEIRVTIAALACVLLLNRHTGVYPGLQHILVYPDAFIARREVQHADGTVSEGEHELLGESWEQGKVILAWEEIQTDIAHQGTGRNVVWHEFAHQLDAEDGLVNGAPAMRHERLQRWAEVFKREFQALQRADARDEPTLLDPYGAESPAEFFAVATETFFGNPGELASCHPQLYRELQRYYRVDPRKWLS